MKDIGRTIAYHRKAAKLSQGELAEQMKEYGFGPSVASVSSWEKNVSIPNAAQFLAICKLLKIENIYSEFIGEITSDPLSGLNEAGKKKVMEFANLLMLSEEYKAEKVDAEKERPDVVKIDSVVKKGFAATKLPSEPVRLIRLYDLAASAGLGEYLDNESYEEIEAGEEVPSNADYGIRINGNSMKPRFHHGDTVWVKQCSVLENGEIGIFVLDGHAYCKKLGKDKNGVKLISLNTEYKPIKVYEDSQFGVLGKVLN